MRKTRVKQHERTISNRRIRIYLAEKRGNIKIVAATCEYEARRRLKVNTVYTVTPQVLNTLLFKGMQYGDIRTLFCWGF